VKFFFLPLILILTSCSLDKNSTYWNEDLIKKLVSDKKILKTSADFKTMTLEEFNLFIKDYSEKTDYPDISN
jgi:hypothetical protein|tara:strand:- start:168 stop:383 length:216 start_codon:yes stop_codon:yes gene_type:complete